MAATGNPPVLDGLIREILEQTGRHEAAPSFQRAHSHLFSVARLDYASSLRGSFDRQQVIGIVREMRRWVPNLNRRVLAATDPRQLSAIASRMGARLLAASFGGRDGRALRGFYADAGMFRRRPLICVNTANHPVAVAAAFWHEVGHHLGRHLFGRSGFRALTFTTNCHEHLSSPSEIIADIVMILGGYPHSAAQRLFGGNDAEAIDRDLNLLVRKARMHLHSISFDFDAKSCAHANLCYLAGMIHVAKLRAALFREFDI
jgi:hypothetical protein